MVCQHVQVQHFRATTYGHGYRHIRSNNADSDVLFLPPVKTVQFPKMTFQHLQALKSDIGDLSLYQLYAIEQMVQPPDQEIVLGLRDELPQSNVFHLFGKRSTPLQEDISPLS